MKQQTIWDSLLLKKFSFIKEMRPTHDVQIIRLFMLNGKISKNYFPLPNRESSATVKVYMKINY